MKTFKSVLATGLTAAALAGFAPKAMAQDLFDGTTNVILSGVFSNNASASGSTFTNVGYQGIGTVSLLSTNIAGSSPTLKCTLMGSGDSSTFTNVDTTKYVVTNTTGNAIGTFRIPLQELPPYLKTTNEMGGTTPQYSYFVILQAPLKYKQ